MKPQSEFNLKQVTTKFVVMIFIMTEILSAAPGSGFAAIVHEPTAPAEPMLQTVPVSGEESAPGSESPSSMTQEQVDTALSPADPDPSTPLPAGAVRTASNRNFYYIVRTQPGSTPEVYDVYDKEGNLIAELKKRTADLRGTYMEALTPPDVSQDGHLLVYSTFKQSTYTNHVYRSIQLQTYDVSGGQKIVPVIVLLQTDNKPVTQAQKTLKVTFAEGNSQVIRVEHRSGKVDFYDASTGKKAERTASNPKFYITVYNGPSSHIPPARKAMYRILDSTGKLFTSLVKDRILDFLTSQLSRQSLLSPDISSDGKYLINVWDVYCTRSCPHKPVMRVRDLESGTALSIDLSLGGEVPSAVSFAKGNPQAIRVEYPSGKVDFYDAATGVKAAVTPSNPNYYITQFKVPAHKIENPLEHRMSYRILKNDGSLFATVTQDRWFEVASSELTIHSVQQLDISKDAKYLMDVREVHCTRASSSCASRLILVIKDLEAKTTKGINLNLDNAGQEFLNARFAGNPAKVRVKFMSGIEVFYAVPSGARITDIDGAAATATPQAMTDNPASEAKSSALLETAGTKAEQTNVFSSDPTLTAANISKLSGLKGVVGIFGKVKQSSPTLFSLPFDVTAAGSFDASISHFDDFGTTNIETQNLSSVAALRVGVRLASGTGTIKLEIEDVDGNKLIGFLKDVTGTEKFYRIPLSKLAGTVDITKIKNINFVIENSRVSDKTSTLFVSMGNHPYIPEITANPNLVPSDATRFSGLKGVIAVGDAQVSQVNSLLTQLAFDLREQGSFAATVSHFDDFGTEGVIETKDLSTLTSLVAGLRFTSGTGTVALELQDADNNKSRVILTGVGGKEKMFEVAISQFKGIDLKKIASINFAVDNGTVSDPTASLMLRLGNHPYTPEIQANPALTISDISHFSNFVEVAAFGAGQATKVNTQRITLDYNFDSGPDKHAGTISSFDTFGTPAIESKNLAGKTLRAGLRLGAGAGDIVVEVKDALGKTSKVIFKGVKTSLQFWSVPLTSFKGVDLTQIASINFIATQDNLTSTQTTLDIFMGDHI